MDIYIDGKEIVSEYDFHRQLARALNVERYYGHNLDAFWDLLSAGVERPVNIIWNGSQISKERLGSTFQKIVEILERAKLRDIEFNLEEKLNYRLL
jgi:ribonuclease inhibitor